MEKLRVYISLALLALYAPAAQAASTSVSSEDAPLPKTEVPQIAVDFSICLGRASAALEYAHLVGQPYSEAQARWDVFRDLLEAIAPDQNEGMSRQLLAQRIKAKMALSRLLTLAQFNDDPRLSTKAQADAMVQLGHCDDLIS